jgi:hypothetical protein
LERVWFNTQRFGILFFLVVNQHVQAIDLKGQGASPWGRAIINMKNHNHEISYECKSIIIEKPEDNFDLLLVMIKDTKPNTWLF